MLVKAKGRSGMARDSRREGLETRLNALREEYLALSAAISNEIDEVKKLRQKRRLEELEHEMGDLERELEALDSKSESLPSQPQPRYQNEQIRELSEELKSAYQQKDELLRTRQDTKAVQK